MSTERRYIFAFAIASEDEIQFMDMTTTIRGQLEGEIEAVKKRVMEDFARAGMTIAKPVLLSATQLDFVRPPTYVELPTMVRRSLEQIVMDAKKSLPSRTTDMEELESWLIAIKEKA